MKNIQLMLVFFVLGVLGLTFSSCMHAVMMGSHDGHEGMASISVTKEVTNGGYSIAVTVPPMEANKEEDITLTLKSKSGVIDSATVHYMIMKSEMVDTSSSHEHGIKGNEDFKQIHQTISIVNGAASIIYKPSASGRFKLTVETTVDSIALSTELSFMVHEKKGKGMMGMMEMGADWDYPIIGVLAMGAMMITMWAIRGGW